MTKRQRDEITPGSSTNHSRRKLFDENCHRTCKHKNCHRTCKHKDICAMLRENDTREYIDRLKDEEEKSNRKIKAFQIGFLKKSLKKSQKSTLPNVDWHNLDDLKREACKACSKQFDGNIQAHEMLSIIEQFARSKNIKAKYMTTSLDTTEKLIHDKDVRNVRAKTHQLKLVSEGSHLSIICNSKFHYCDETINALKVLICFIQLEVGFHPKGGTAIVKENQIKEAREILLEILSNESLNGHGSDTKDPVDWWQRALARNMPTGIKALAAGCRLESSSSNPRARIELSRDNEETGVANVKKAIWAFFKPTEPNQVLQSSPSDLHEANDENEEPLFANVVQEAPRYLPDLLGSLFNINPSMSMSPTPQSPWANSGIPNYYLSPLAYNTITI